MDQHAPAQGSPLRVCLKCGAEAAAMPGSSAKCPSCGAYYAKVEAAQAKRAAAAQEKARAAKRRAVRWMLASIPIGLGIAFGLIQYQNWRDEKALAPVAPVARRAATPTQAIPSPVAALEHSAFFSQHPQTSARSDWDLKAGSLSGMHYYKWSVTDPEPSALSSAGVSISVAPTDDRAFVVGVSFHGNSVNDAAQLTPFREQLLRDLLAVTAPGVDLASLTALVQREQAKDYPGGSDTIPVQPLGDAQVQAGTNGESLIVSVRVGGPPAAR